MIGHDLLGMLFFTLKFSSVIFCDNQIRDRRKECDDPDV